MDILEMDAVNSSIEEPVAAPVQNVSYDKPKNPLTGLVVALSVLVMILLAGAAYLFVQNQKLVISSTTPTPAPSVQTSAVASADPTAGWQTYTDAKNIFSFMYPPEFQVGKSDVAYVTYLTTADFRTSQSGYKIQVERLENANNDTIENAKKKIHNTPGETFLDEQKEVDVNGYTVLVTTYKDAWKQYKDYYIYSPNVAVSFHGEGLDHSVLDRIVDSFQFTGGWQTYTNTKQNITFKYPKKWELTETPGDTSNGQVINQNVTLSNSPASISMNFNMMGIGGKGMDYQGTPMQLSGTNVYKYKVNMDNGNTLIGITDELKESLGVFQFNGKTYSLSLVYPKNDTNKNYESDFDAILSTFKFTDTVK